jgi:HEPN domain-containing protein
MDPAHRRLVELWLSKAANDLGSARTLAVTPEYRDNSAYLCQQAAEKAIKGFLAAFERPIRRTHDVLSLIQEAKEIEPCWSTWEDAAIRLTEFAWTTRYPDETLVSPSEEDVNEALDDAETILGQVLSFLPPGIRHPKIPGDDVSG